MRGNRAAAGALVLAVAVVASGQDASALKRALRTRVANYDNAPVLVRQASVDLVQTYGTPSQVPMPAVPGLDGGGMQVSRSHVRYVNRLNQQAPTYSLEGEIELQNGTRKEVSALKLTTIFLNAFHERIGTDQQMLAQPLLPRQTKRVDWSRALPHEDVYEMFVVINAVRYSDGTVWTPSEELIVIP